MNTNLESGDQSTSKPITSLAVLGARLTWILLGPLVLLGITWGIVSQGTGWFTGLDAAFAVVVGLMVLGRWVEARSGTATTLTGEPASGAYFKRYVTILLPLAVVVWVAANVLGNHILKGR
jgi:ABC-type polysaccharide/polyol phosphate export permease